MSEGNAWLAADRPLIIGHRGASHAAPENTLAAFRLALEEGADGIEFDVQPAADGVPVVIHDHTLNRTTNGRGPVDRLPAAELGRLDAGQGEPVPTLEAVFAEFGSRLLYNVEIKDVRWRNHGTERAIAAAIARHDLAGRVAVSSFSPWAMRRARQVMPPGVVLGQLRYIGLQKYSYLIFSGQADHPYHPTVDERYMAWARKRGYRVHVWTVDDLAEARRLVDLGVHALITNTPAALRAGLEGK